MISTVGGNVSTAATELFEVLPVDDELPGWLLLLELLFNDDDTDDELLPVLVVELLLVVAELADELLVSPLDEFELPLALDVDDELFSWLLFENELEELLLIVDIAELLLT